MSAGKKKNPPYSKRIPPRTGGKGLNRMKKMNKKQGEGGGGRVGVGGRVVGLRYGVGGRGGERGRDGESPLVLGFLLKGLGAK